LRTKNQSASFLDYKSLREDLETALQDHLDRAELDSLKDCCCEFKGVYNTLLYFIDCNEEGVFPNPESTELLETLRER
jgi:hypothetical protein